MNKKDVIIIGGGGSSIDPEVMKKLAEAGATEVVAVDSLPDELDKEIKRPSFHVPDMDEIMIMVKNKEAARKKRLRDMGRAQFKKKNRRKF